MSYSLQLNKRTTITTGITASDMSLTLTSAVFTNFTGDYLVIDYDNPTKLEVIKCNVVGTAVTITNRGQEGTAATTHDAGAKIAYVFVPSHYSDLVTLATTTSASGWLSPSATHTYASGTTITVPTGAASVYSVGDKYKCEQSIPLTSYWNMDGNSTDTKGSNNGTDTNMSYTATGTKFTQHAVFNGTNGYITIADATNLKPTGAFTLGMWVKTSTSGKVAFQSYSDNTNANGIKLFTLSNTLRFAVGNNAADPTTTMVGVANVCDGNWHYVVVTFQSNFCKIFVDGVLDVSGYCVTPTYAATNYIKIGCDDNAGTEGSFWNGAIDDVFLINGFAVDSQWVAAKYAEGTAQTNANITATQYFYVTTVADQLLTVTGGADYVLYNATISSPYYSKAQSPVGFPRIFNFPGNATGFSAITSAQYEFSYNNGWVELYCWVTGTSNNAALVITAPITAYNGGVDYYRFSTGQGEDNGTAFATGYNYIQKNTANITCTKSNGVAFTASGTKTVFLNGKYRAN